MDQEWIGKEQWEQEEQLEGLEQIQRVELVKYASGDFSCSFSRNRIVVDGPIPTNKQFNQDWCMDQPLHCRNHENQFTQKYLVAWMSHCITETFVLEKFEKEKAMWVPDKEGVGFLLLKS